MKDSPQSVVAFKNSGGPFNWYVFGENAFRTIINSMAALNSMVANSCSMAVQAILDGDRDMLYWSVLYDPLTAAVCSMQEIRDLVDELFEKDKDELPTFTD